MLSVKRFFSRFCQHNREKLLKNAIFHAFDYNKLVITLFNISVASITITIISAIIFAIRTIKKVWTIWQTINKTLCLAKNIL